MQRLEVTAVRPLFGSLGVKGLTVGHHQVAVSSTCRLCCDLHFRNFTCDYNYFYDDKNLNFNIIILKWMTTL